MFKKTFIAAAVLVVAASIALPAAAYADDYTGAIDSNAAAPGATFTYSNSTGQPEGTAGQASLVGETDGAPVGGAITPAVFGPVATGNFTVGAGGNMAIHVTIPKNATPGASFTLNVAAGTFSASPTFSVASPTAAAAPSGPVLSFTGFDAVPYFWFGGGLLVLGAGLIVVLTVVRRSRRIPSQA
jgi:hypothetical protein